MKKEKQKSKEQNNVESYAEEWDLENGLGILPEDISLTQNIGCVGGRKKATAKKKPNVDEDISS